MAAAAAAPAEPLLPGGVGPRPARGAALRRGVRWAAAAAAAAGGAAAGGRLCLRAASASQLRAGLPSAVALPAAGKVPVKLYGMAGCPFTRAFIEGPLSETVAVVPEMIDLDFVTFGNCYYAMDGCGAPPDVPPPFASFWHGYDQGARQCWDMRCGAVSRGPAENCFRGELLCQHGVTDGMVTTSWACAVERSGGNFSSYMPFVACTAERFLGIVDEASFNKTVLDCASAGGFSAGGTRGPARELLECAAGAHGRSLLNAQGRRTIMHPGVPYVTVDGEVLDDVRCVACGDGIMQKVCEAWRRRAGAVPPVCEALFGVS